MKVQVKATFFKRRLEILTKISPDLDFKFYEDRVVMSTGKSKAGLEWVSTIKADISDYEDKVINVEVKSLLARLKTYKDEKMDDKITLEIDGTDIKVKMKSTRATYKGVYSSMTDKSDDYESLFTLPPSEVQNIMDYMLIAVGDDYSFNSALDGICIASDENDSISATATNQNIMTDIIFKSKHTEEFKYVIDGSLWRSLINVKKELNTSGEINFQTSESNPDIMKILVDVDEHFVLYGKRLVGEFPLDTVKLIREKVKEDCKTIKLDATPIKEAMKRIKTSKSEYLKLRFKGEYVDLSVPDYTERVKLKKEVDEEFSITLNVTNFGEVMSKLKDNVTMKVPEKLNIPVLMYPGSYNTSIMKSINFYINRISNK